MRILALHHDCLSLQGPTRLFLMMCDLFMHLGYEVQIVARTKRATRWKTSRGVITERLASKQYHLRELRKYHPLKYVDPQDIIQAELPLTYPYNYMPKALEDAIPKADLAFIDTEIYLPLAKYIPGNYLFYIHWPPKPMRENRPFLMPAAPAKIWVNSTYTANEVKRLWGSEWNGEWPPLDPQVVYPPLWVSMYDSSPRFDERPCDVVLFSRLYEDKIRFLDDLRTYRLAVVGSDYGLKIPPWVTLWKGVPLKTVIHVLGHSKVYVHCKGFGQLNSGAISEKEHFGQTLVESMSAGCVPIVPEGGGPMEIIGSEEEYGYTFSSVQELKAKISMLLGDEGLWTEMSRNAVKRAKDFDVPKIAEKVEKLLSYHEA